MTEHWALKYLGKPWEPGKSGPDSYDCWGLVRAVYAKKYLVDLPIIDVDPGSPHGIRKAIARDANRSGWIETPFPVEGDIVVMSQGNIPHHIGVYLSLPEGGHIIHAVEGAGVVVQGKSSLSVHGWNITGYYTREGKCEQ